jgi:hypothetical protein
VVEEGELVIAGERREPEGQAGEVDRHRILVDGVETTLGDQAPRQ